MRRGPHCFNALRREVGEISREFVFPVRALVEK